MASHDENEIKQTLYEYFLVSGGNVVIDPQTGVIDVLGDASVKLKKEIKKLPVKFGRVDGNFICYNNQLTSLQGAPTSVGRRFYCFDNKLTSLEHAPTSVGGDFDCSNNQLTSLEHAPTSVGGNFNCSNNQLTSLQGGPRSIRGSLTITVYPNTPLLRILLIQGISSFHLWDSNVKYIDELNTLFEKYYPQGRQGILKCGLEMMSIENGKYANNARMGPK